MVSFGKQKVPNQGIQLFKTVSGELAGGTEGGGQEDKQLQLMRARETSVEKASSRQRTSAVWHFVSRARVSCCSWPGLAAQPGGFSAH